MTLCFTKSLAVMSKLSKKKHHICTVLITIRTETNFRTLLHILWPHSCKNFELLSCAIFESKITWKYLWYCVEGGAHKSKVLDDQIRNFLPDNAITMICCGHHTGVDKCFIKALFRIRIMILKMQNKNVQHFSEMTDKAIKLVLIQNREVRQKQKQSKIDYIIR